MILDYILNWNLIWIGWEHQLIRPYAVLSISFIFYLWEVESYYFDFKDLSCGINEWKLGDKVNKDAS